MLYFWLTSAVHIANRASMESVDKSGTFSKKKKKKPRNVKKRPSTSSEPDLTAVVPPMTNRPRTNSQACISYASTSSLSESEKWRSKNVEVFATVAVFVENCPKKYEAFLPSKSVKFHLTIIHRLVYVSFNTPKWPSFENQIMN